MLSTKELSDIATILRRDSLISTTHAGSGHPTSCLSSADIMSVLFFSQMSYDPHNPTHPENDEFILSKGHAAPILYSSLKRSGCINDYLATLRKLTSNLEGHPMPRSLDWIKVATGSLGQGLSVALGFALAAKLSKRKYKTYVLLGDSELAEGSNYEALQLATHYNLNNLVAIADINGLGQRGKTMLAHDLATYSKRFSAFGWNVLTIDGHNIKQIQRALNKAKSSKKPTMILAKTFKGKGISFIENKENWHGKTLSEIQLKEALKELSDPELPEFIPKKPKLSLEDLKRHSNLKLPRYIPSSLVATREAYGHSLSALAKANPQILALDAEVSNSTHSNEVPTSQFLEMFIAEQNLIGTALGLSRKGFIPFASTFAAFLSRADDQIRMASLSDPVNLNICGSHVGVSIGEDGAPQIALSDLAFFRSLPKSTVLYPSDAISTGKLLEFMATNEGLKYIRTTRPKTPILYSEKEKFPINSFKVLKKSKKDKAVIVAAGITVHEALKASKELKKQGKNLAVLDCYSIKPFPEEKLIEFANFHGKKIIVVEDHRPEGGLGEAVAKAISNTNIKLIHLAVNEIPHSGTKEELMQLYNIDSNAIINSI